MQIAPQPTLETGRDQQSALGPPSAGSHSAPHFDCVTLSGAAALHRAPLSVAVKLSRTPPRGAEDHRNSIFVMPMPQTTARD
jgi:hypothetical protein